MASLSDLPGLGSGKPAVDPKAIVENVDRNNITEEMSNYDDDFDRSANMIDDSINLDKSRGAASNATSTKQYLSQAIQGREGGSNEVGSQQSLFSHSKKDKTDAVKDAK